ncbi:hypothetical protein OAQ29_04085 [Candidatus Pelagibacter sp.]|nr:hypothetical protein [Candidatus Pelagibacter sp.]
MKCLFCSSKKKIKSSNLPLFRHLDFKSTHKSSKFIICKRCGHLSSKEIKKNQFLKTSQYANSNQTNKKILVKNKLIKDRIYYQNKIGKKFRSKKILNISKKEINKKNMHLIDTTKDFRWHI